MNKSDSERAEAVLQDIGYRRTENQEEADLILVMACSVRQSAIDRIFGKKRAWDKNKAIKILSGCVLKDDKPKMKKIFDYFLDTKDLVELRNILVDQKKIKKAFFSIKPVYESSFSASVPIMTGCDNFCTYCAVPYTKGREISRPFNDILQEVNELISKGYKEIILLGQNVNSYGKDLKNRKHNFANLLKSVNKIPGEFWIRFITSNPHDMTDEIITAIAESEKVTEYIHLPIQAGNNEILKKMNRKYSREDYFSLVEKLRTKIPGMSLSTDTIVGFPGETKKQFEDTKKAYIKMKYDMAYIAQYSKRPGTPAAKMSDKLTKQEKAEREKELTKILRKTALSFNKNYLNKKVEVLVDRKDKNYFYGRTRAFKLVQFKSDKTVLGKFVLVEIKSVTPWAMKGSIKK